MVRALCSHERSFLPLKQKRNTPRNFEIKRLFRNAFSERSKCSEKERDERSLHGVPGQCSQVRPLLLAELKRDTPRNFDMKRLIRNAFSERPILHQHAEYPCILSLLLLRVGVPAFLMTSGYEWFSLDLNMSSACSRMPSPPSLESDIRIIRSCNPKDPAVLKIGQMHSGTARGAGGQRKLEKIRATLFGGAHKG